MQTRNSGGALVAALLALTIGAASAQAKIARVGEPAPDFEGTTLAGEEVSFAALKGNVIIVNFWATWCPPCLKELPLIHAYAAARESYGLRVLAVTLDAKQAKKGVLEKLQSMLAFPLLKRFDGKDYRLIGKAIPTNYIIDRQGVSAAPKAQPFTLDEMNKLLVPLLSEPPPVKEAAATP